MTDRENMDTFRWILLMAWRDSRGSRRKMAIFVSSMVLGVAALVSINSFGDSLRSAVDSQAGELLGADLSFESTRPFTDRIEAVVDSIGGQQSRRTSFASMAYFPRTDDARLATVRANEGGYPYYGAIETDPASASELYLEGRNALVDGTLMEQFNVAIGDSVQIGDRMYRVAGRLLQTPRETAAVMLFSPRIYIPSRYLDRSLLQKGSRAEYEVYFQFDDGRDVETLVDDLKPVLVAEQVTTDTIQEQKDGWDQSLSNLYRFLSLVGFMALLLGSLGVASAVNRIRPTTRANRRRTQVLRSSVLAYIRGLSGTVHRYGRRGRYLWRPPGVRYPGRSTRVVG